MSVKEYPYEIINPQGQPVMESIESCRYPKETELSLLDAGYTIKLYGRKITKTEIRKGAQHK